MARSSHCHLLASGRKTDGAEATDTELLDDAADAVLHDTEVVHYPDYVENSETDLQYGSDIEVVPDSDDEMMGANDSRFLSRRVSFIKSLAAELSKVESHSHPLCKKLDQSNMDSDAFANEGHTSCLTTDMIVCQGNKVSPIIAHSDILATELGLQDRNMRTVKDPRPTDSISSDVNLADDVKQMSVESEVEKNATLCLQKKREVSVVYTRRKNSLCKPKDNEAKDVKRLTGDCNDYTGLSYVESQEPDDLSTALLFVDQYLSINAVPMSSSPVTTVKTKQKSPLSLSAKGVQSLVRWSGVRNSENKAGIFEWNDSLDGDGGCIPLVNRGQPQLASGNKKYNYTYVRRSPSVKTSAFNKQVHKKNVGEDTNRELGQHTADESTLAKTETNFTLTKTEISTINEDSEHFFDVGIGTQIAVEAMQALSSSISAVCNEMDDDKCPQKIHDKSNEDTQKQMHAGVWSFPKKTRSAYRDTLGPKNRKRIYCSESQEDIIQASKQMVGTNGGKLTVAKCVVGRSSLDSGKVKTTKKAKAYRAKELYIGKENLNGSSSGNEVPLWKLNNRRKIKNTRPSSTNLKSSSLFNVSEGLVSKPMSKSVAYTKSAPYDKRKDGEIMGNILDVSAEKAYVSKDFTNVSLNTREMKFNGEDRRYSVVDGCVVDMLVEKKSGKMENIRKEGSTCSKTFSDARNTIVSPECNSVQSTSWCLRDHPRGKRTGRSILDHSEGYSDLGDLSIKRSREKCNHHSLRYKLNGESCSGSSAFYSGVKRKRRSTVYISPCLLSSKKSERNMPRHPVSELKKNAPANESDYAKKKNTLSEQLTESPFTVKASNVDVTGYKANENLNSPDATFPSCQASTSEEKTPKLVDGYCEHHDKKKPSTPSLTRELHRLGFRESMPDFTSKTFRRRKTMANICVMLSQNLDESTRKHQKKILTRFGVPIASCPSDATHFITDRFARTRNMLEFIAQGKPVVTHQWLESCNQTGFYVDDRDYIVRDVKKERKFGFKLSISLDRARHHPLLKGYRIFITPNAKPGKEILASLVKAVHGEVVNVVTDSKLDNLLVLSCDEDQAYCIPFLQRGTSAYSPELLLDGIIIQKLEFARHKLFTVQ